MFVEQYGQQGDEEQARGEHNVGSVALYGVLMGDDEVIRRIDEGVGELFHWGGEN